MTATKAILMTATLLLLSACAPTGGSRGVPVDSKGVTVPPAGTDGVDTPTRTPSNDADAPTDEETVTRGPDTRRPGPGAGTLQIGACDQVHTAVTTNDWGSYTQKNFYAEIDVAGLDPDEAPIVSAWLCGVQLSPADCPDQNACTSTGKPFYGEFGDDCVTTAVRIGPGRIRVHCGWENTNQPKDAAGTVTFYKGASVRVRVL